VLPLVQLTAFTADDPTPLSSGQPTLCRFGRHQAPVAVHALQPFRRFTREHGIKGLPSAVRNDIEADPSKPLTHPHAVCGTHGEVDNPALYERTTIGDGDPASSFRSQNTNLNDGVERQAFMSRRSFVFVEFPSSRVSTALPVDGSDTYLERLLLSAGFCPKDVYKDGTEN
jgi:hypothetical protein